MITKEQFDNLKIGDIVVDSKNRQFTIIDRTVNVIFTEPESSNYVDMCSLNILNTHNYSIKESPKHLYGIPYGDYYDKEVYVLVSNVSLSDCNMETCDLALLNKVSVKGFHTYKYGITKYAKVISNNVKLLKENTVFAE